ncbi:MAG TPA: YciI family protein [Jatrophihabitans sp.]
MRVMVLVKANEDSEKGIMPTTEELTEMGAYNEELVKAGVMLAGDGLRASSHAKRVRFDGNTKTVIDGPFTETKELVAGYWIWEVASLEEAVEWLKRAPFGGGAEVELRPFHTPEDFGEAFTPELQEQEARLRAESEQG